MKNIKKFTKIVTLLLLISILFSAFNLVLAAPETSTAASNIFIRGIITNLVEPEVGAAPNFTCDIETGSTTGHNVNFLKFLAWVEIDPDVADGITKNDFEGTHTIMNSLATKVTMNENMYIDSESTGHILRAFELSDSTQQYVENSLNSTFTPIEKFLPNKTYLAIFIGQHEGPFTNIPLTEVTGHVDDEVIPESVDQVDQMIQFGDNRIVDASVNGHVANVKAYLASAKNEFAIVARYDLGSPVVDKKATIKWVNASENEIPESMNLKLLSGDTVLDEVTITKEDNAVDEKTWEYDFGEYPVYDEYGTPIDYKLVYQESTTGDLHLFESTQDGFIVTNVYNNPELTSAVKMSASVDKDKNNVQYSITHTAKITKYAGNADVVLRVTLPFAVNVEKSDLNGGTYDKDTKTITWTETIEDIEGEYNYSVTKVVSLYSTDELPYSIEAKSIGQVQLLSTSTSSVTQDISVVKTKDLKNPQTGDTIKKYSIFFAIAVALYLVTRLMRKYGIKKNNIQY
jgi:hypothetical protein